MANWLFELDIQDVWERTKRDEITVLELSKDIVEKIKGQLLPKVRARFGEASHAALILTDIMADFERFVEEEDDDKDAFDVYFGRLYDWADQKVSLDKWPPDALCWIKTVL
jgi:hypothetical protein